MQAPLFAVAQNIQIEICDYILGLPLQSGLERKCSTKNSIFGALQNLLIAIKAFFEINLNEMESPQTNVIGADLKRSAGLRRTKSAAIVLQKKRPS